MRLKQNKTSLKHQIEKLTYLVWEKLSSDNKWDKTLLKPSDVRLEHPEQEKFGDYSCNIAMVLASKLKQSPLSIAQKMADALNKDLLREIEKIEVVKPGFINISIKNNYFISQIQKVLKEGENYGKSSGLKGKKIMVEFTDPNPFKEFHIGHLYSNIVGESVARLFEASGAVLKRVNYQGDVGMHVAKSLWGLKQKMVQDSLSLKDLAKKSLQEKINYLGQSYALGAKAFKEDKNKAVKIKNINYLVYIAGQERLQKEENWEPQVDYRKYVQYSAKDYQQITELYNKGRQWSLEYFETIYKRLGTKFDYYYFESVAGEYGHKIVSSGLKKGIFKNSKGAIVYLGEKKGLHTRVFINSFGLPTYEAKDLGLAHIKYNDFHYDHSFNVTGNEINEYFKVVLSALKDINKDLWKKTTHLGHGMVRLPEGKMSSRTGKVLTGEWLIAETKKQVKEVFKKSNSQVKKQKKEGLAEQVALAAVKYALLKSSIGKDTIFDLKKSVSLQGNSGPYLQYTYARAKSVLQKSKASKHSLSVSNYQPNKEEKSILRQIDRFLETVEDSAQNHAPNLICSYLYELAQRFNAFYNQHKILKAVKDKKEFRLLLTRAVAQILNNGLYLLGIKAPEKM